MTAMYQSLVKRNRLLANATLISLLLALLLALIALFDHRQVLGINLWIKPIKFLLSFVIFMGSMAFFLSLLPAKRGRAIRKYGIVVVVVFIIEFLVIGGQAARGQLSHFNYSTPINGILFQLMGIAILTFTFWSAVVANWFWKAPPPEEYPPGFWWGIRIGMILFVIFSLMGMLMAINLRHSIGGADGGPGLPLVNWSRNHGDLRVAHFVGIHALQVLPLLGYFWFRRPVAIWVAGMLYTAFSVGLFLQALSGKPLL